MRLAIRHETTYSYAAPVSYTIQLLRLTPRSHSGQRILDWTIETPGRRHRHMDAFGNVTHTLVLTQPHRAVRVAVHGTVEVNALPNGRLPPDADDGPPRESFLVSTPLTRPTPEIAAFARAHAPRGLRNATDALLLAAAIRDRITYQSGVTDVTSTAAHALELGTGVCQDHAHLFIACCRLLDTPARYVSGYIHPGDTSHTASHAWADVWLPDSGWISIDVTHAQYTADWHCRVALGRDYESASPVRGLRTGGGHEDMHVRVTVAEHAQ